ncbi:hypothetical protein KIPB_004996, partial [Kipferlia bialata]
TTAPGFHSAQMHSVLYRALSRKDPNPVTIESVAVLFVIAENDIEGDLSNRLAMLPLFVTALQTKLREEDPIRKLIHLILLALVNAICGAHAATALRLGAHTLAMDAVARFSSSYDICNEAVAVLSSMANDMEPDHLQRAMVQAGVVQTCRTAMLAHPTSAGIAGQSLDVISLMCLHKDRDEQTLGPLMSQRVYEWALEALSAFLQDPFVVDRAIKVLQSLQTLFASLHMHIDDEELTECHLMLLNTMYHYADDDQYIALMDMDLVGCMARARDRHPTNVEIIRHYFDLKRMEAQPVSIRCQIARDKKKREQEGHNCEYPEGRQDPDWEKQTTYGESKFDEETGMLLLNDETLDDIVKRQMALKFNQDLGCAMIHYGKITIPELSARVVYFPDSVGQKGLDDFCASLCCFYLTATPLCTVKNPSALKRLLAASDRHVVVCTHDVVGASPTTKTHKLHMCMWREFAKRGVNARAYMALDEAQVCEDEGPSRGVYTHLSSVVRTHYLDKMPQEMRDDREREGDNPVTCLPLGQYYQESWGDYAHC